MRRFPAAALGIGTNGKIMLHSLLTAQASLENDARLAPVSGAVLRGPARPDLIRDELLCEIFAATVARQPSAIAMITPQGKFTYAEINEKAEIIARGLLQKGLRPGRVAGLWMPRGSRLTLTLQLNALPCAYPMPRRGGS